MDLERFKLTYCTVESGFSEDGWGPAPMTILRVWQFMTGLSPEQIDDEEGWRSFLAWPPDVFALCAVVLKRSGSYASALQSMSGKQLKDHILSKVWLDALSGREFTDDGCADQAFPKQLENAWKDLWKCRWAPLSRITECDELMSLLIGIAVAADQISKGSGLPISERDIPPVRYRLISYGWKLLEPTRYGSSLCSKKIHPNAARVLPKLHVAQSGMTLRSLSHNLALCESAEVQPRWFMIPGARGDVASRHHANLLILPWPLTIDPAQFQESVKRERQLDTRYFDYKGHPTSGLADVIAGFCDEARRALGSLDGVVMPELALTGVEYESVQKRVLAEKVMLIAGVGLGATADGSGSNHVCVDVPLSKNHAVHFRQAKHHRWKLDRSQIVRYGIGARLNPDNSYWENIDIASRKLLFLVLRPWLVTSILICEDLARYDPVGELLSGVGPHFVAALLMDGPQLASRWSSRYATALADDPGCSVVSVSSLGMVGLSRPDPSRAPSRTVALWKDSREGAKELSVPSDSEALAVTVSVESFDELSADGRLEKAWRPVLTGVHPIKRKSLSGDSESPQPDIRFLAPHEAADLARLVQQQGQANRSPELLMGLTGEARAIGLEVWRLMTDYPSGPQLAEARKKRREFARLPEARHTETAEEICRWHATNVGMDAERKTLFPGEWQTSA
jgi:hypothetical protein